MRIPFVFALMASFSLYAQEAESTLDVSQQSFIKSLNFQVGDVRIPAAKAMIHASAAYPLLGAKDAQRVLEELWGNPPDDSVLGMIVPGKTGLIGAHAWAVVLTYADDGYVSDKEANEINYDDMLKEMQQSTRAGNAERKSAGYGSIELHGWATRPRYDSTTAKLYWAKDLSFDGSANHTLNYDVRALGRSGYLSMNAIADVKDLAAIEAGMPEVIKMAEFEAGARYADYNSATDRTAEYGLAALIGGGIAAKTGLLAKLFALLIAAKKLLVVGVIALFGLVKKMFSGNSDSQNKSR
jgi:uncharacterized membrane-anchored protein